MQAINFFYIYINIQFHNKPTSTNGTDRAPGAKEEERTVFQQNDQVQEYSLAGICVRQRREYNINKERFYNYGNTEV
jgi:hypothetical protein